MTDDLLKKYPFALLMAVCVLMLIPHLGMLQTNIMEARNLISAREMAADGHWIFTTINQFPRYEKPPLPTWLTAFFGTAAGFENMFFLRLPAALITMLLTAFFYRLMKRIKPDNNFPLYSSLILITSFYIFFAGRDNQWDIYCHAFMVGAIFFFHRMLAANRVSLINILTAGIFFGCSFLCKGPVSPYALFLPFAAAYYFVYRPQPKLFLTALVGVLLIGLIIGLSWPFYVRIFDAPHVSAALSQEAERWSGYNKRPFWYYWSFFVQSGIWTVPAFVALLYPYMIKRVSQPQAYRLSFFWTIFSVVLLSVIPEKKARYLLPVLIPLAMNTGFYIEYLMLRFREISNRTEIISTRFVFGISALAALCLPFAVPLLIKDLPRNLYPWLIAGGVVSIACSLLMFRGLAARKFLPVFSGIVVLMCGVITCWIPLSKSFYKNEQFSSAEAIHLTEQKRNIRTFEANGFTPEIIWDFGRSVPEIFRNNKLVLPADTAFGLLVIPGEENRWRDSLRNYKFETAGRIDLNSVSPGKRSYNVRLVKNFFILTKQR